MTGHREDRVLKAATGLEGGVVATGSTCGVVTAGAIGLALIHSNRLETGEAAEAAGVLDLAGQYVRWFDEKYGSSLCRKRTGVDFHSPGGMIRYFLPGHRVLRCLWHIRGAMRRLYDLHRLQLTEVKVKSEESRGDPVHCAQAVLEIIRKRTGIGDPLLERLSLVMDGGVGLTGGVCGALAGAVMGLNLTTGIDVRKAGFFGAIQAFTIGHINILRDRPPHRPETFTLGKQVVNQFMDVAGAMECRTLTGRTFTDWDDFQRHMASSQKCEKLITQAAEAACLAIEKGN